MEFSYEVLRINDQLRTWNVRNNTPWVASALSSRVSNIHVCDSDDFVE